MFQRLAVEKLLENGESSASCWNELTSISKIYMELETLVYEFWMLVEKGKMCMFTDWEAHIKARSAGVWFWSCFFRWGRGVVELLREEQIMYFSSLRTSYALFCHLGALLL